jgi:hypothetical protein
MNGPNTSHKKDVLPSWDVFVASRPQLRNVGRRVKRTWYSWIRASWYSCESNQQDMIWYICNCNWVATQWHLFSAHIPTNNTGNVTKQTIQRTQKHIEQHKKYIEQHNNQEECGPCPVFADFTLAFALQLRKKHGKPQSGLIYYS